MINIHFVCTGNIYRSRLAEAYLNSKQLPDIKVNSSGVEAGKSEQVDITWYTLKIIEKNNLLPFISPTFQKTNESLLSKADMIIFMTKYHYDYCVTNLNYNSTNYEIWGVEDMTAKILSMGTEETIAEASKTFQLIKNKVDNFVENLK